MKLSAEYSAGLFDGEGSVYVARRLPTEDRNYAYYCLKALLGNTNREVLEALQETWGGAISGVCKPKKPQHKQYWHWRLSPKNAVKFFNAILPFLIIKKAVVEKALQLQALHRMGGGHRKYSDEQMAARNALFLDIRRLNHKGSLPFDPSILDLAHMK